MTVDDILSVKGREVITIAADSSLEDVAKSLLLNRVGALVVVAGSAARMVGIVTERDVVRLVAERGAAALSLPASAAMTGRVLTCAPGDSVDGLMALITRERIRHIPVFDHENMVGIVSIGDVVKHRLDEQATEIGMWRELFTPR